MDANLPGTFLLNGPALAPFPEAKAPVCQYSVQSSFYKLCPPALGTPHGISDILSRPAAPGGSIVPSYPHAGALNGLSSTGVYYGPQVGALPKAGSEFLPRGRGCWAEAAPDWRGARQCGGRKYSGAGRAVMGGRRRCPIEPCMLAMGGTAQDAPWPASHVAAVGMVPAPELLDGGNGPEMLDGGNGLSTRAAGWWEWSRAVEVLTQEPLQWERLTLWSASRQGQAEPMVLEIIPHCSSSPTGVSAWLGAALGRAGGTLEHTAWVGWEHPLSHGGLWGSAPTATVPSPLQVMLLEQTGRAARASAPSTASSRPALPAFRPASCKVRGRGRGVGCCMALRPCAAVVTPSQHPSVLSSSRS